ncbi:hypothetical protein [Rhizobium sp. SGZ-381]|uniref:hypothetical protein n=1 Tax=Rhizobium sp. SGZ-381 TaxID=3342800 RepID=UPI00366DD391
MRAFSSLTATALKAATISGFEAVGGVSRASDLLGVGAGTLSKYASTSEEWSRNFIRVDLAVALDAASGHPFITGAMGELLGARRPQTFGELTAAAVLKLNGLLDDVVREVALAIDDGHVDAAERQAVKARIVPAMQALAQLDAIISRVMA